MSPQSRLLSDRGGAEGAKTKTGRRTKHTCLSLSMAAEETPQCVCECVWVISCTDSLTPRAQTRLLSSKRSAGVIAWLYKTARSLHTCEAAGVRRPHYSTINTHTDS